MTDEAAPIAAEQPLGDAENRAAPVEAPELAQLDAIEPVAEEIAVPDNLTVTVTPEGAGHIFKGELIGGVEQTYAEGDQLTLPTQVAVDYVDRGYAVQA